jgi:hypothetical protein
MTERKRRVLSVTVPEWLVREVSSRYSNVSEFAERALTNQLRMESQVHAIEVLAGDGDPELGRKRLDEFETQPGYAALAKEWDRGWKRAEAELKRLHRKRR